MGLRRRMAGSYAIVTAGAVLVVEGVLLGVYVPSLLSGSDLQTRLQDQASRDAKVLSLTLTKIGEASPGSSGRELLVAAAGAARREIALASTPPGYAGGVAITHANGVVTDQPIEVLTDGEGEVVVSSAGTYPRGSTIRPSPPTGGGTGVTAAGKAVWWTSPVLAQRSTGVPTGVPDDGGQGSDDKASLSTAGYLYVQAPPDFGDAFSPGAVLPMVVPGALALSLVLPVGLLFGLLSTRRLIGRVQRLAVAAGAVSQGDFRPRVPVTNGDEVGRLEESFNLMTERLSDAVAAERLSAEAEARHAERARIARELHDSISQDLFSLRLLAAGMRRAAPAVLRSDAEAMERTAARAMREMQALLLELRPVALEDAGLVPALDELCHAYEIRLGIRVEASLEEMALPAAIEHAVLRLVQEALANAVKHAEPSRVKVVLRRTTGDTGETGDTGDTGDTVAVEIRDDGRGFGPESAAARHGMGLALMRERVGELGGVFELVSEPGRGTCVSARIPVREPAGEAS
ncbi:HAMP domain-containing protein [Microbispora sp. RL4-1S]|uniref:Oxygen sensor histidine kinase NreB n=1 Tax=Microbispora oryzae TaxID=2806554 RepID=A0A941AJU0_9ACTN|nr:ATP-binding protein [Microbispora oryzae]MBP2706556.1 HAMP domain-containing protein [Microbispora oryzae]